MNNPYATGADITHQWYCTFLGTGDSLGVPRVYCECDICKEARMKGSNRRLRSAVLVHQGEQRLMIDCGPDWGVQMESSGLRFIPEILITHAHYDHIAGLPAYADACRWLQCKGNVHAPQEVLDLILRMFPWLPSMIDFTAIESHWQWCDWTITPGRVNHGKNGYSYAYRFERNTQTDSFRWVYASDAINLNQDELKLFQHLNLLILGTSFYQEPYSQETRSVYDMVEALQLVNQLQPEETIFTHMSHDIDVCRNYQLPVNVRLARTGMSVLISQK